MAQRVGRRRVIAIAAVALAVVVALGVVSGTFSQWGRQGLYATGLWVDGGASTLPPSALGQPSASAPTPPPVLGAASAGPTLNTTQLAAKIGAVDLAEVGTVSAEVRDATTGAVLYQSRQTTPMIPASTMKLLTTASALTLLGPEHRFVTSVVSTSPGSIVLVGGGDPYLVTEADPNRPGKATVPELARLTAAALKAKGTSTVQLGYDASLFAGPGWNPTWPSGYESEVASTNALWVNGARTQMVNPGPRDRDPALAAATAFAAELTKQGITVTGNPSVVRAPETATAVAEVASESLDVIVESILRTSDNDAAEVLFRQVSVAAGGDGSATSSAAAVKAELTKLGVWHNGTVVVDGSGMSRSNLVPAVVTNALLQRAVGPDHLELRSMITGMPVAGADGSLRSRYFASGTEAGRGLVRAKTGTLTGVHALAGYTQTRSGRMVTFTFTVNGGQNALADRNYLDRVTAAVASCGC